MSRAMPFTVRPAAAAATGLVVLLLGGCAWSGGTPAAERVARDLERAVGDQDGPGVCELLSAATRNALEEQEGKDCADAVGGLDLPVGTQVRSVQVWGRSAAVDFGNELVFLTARDDGWAVVAAGCRPQGDDPADCQLEGS